MPEFRFIRTIRYTEEVTVEATSLDEAKVLAEDAEGDRNHDDTVVSIEQVKN